jgi:hypothetical protein
MSQALGYRVAPRGQVKIKTPLGAFDVPAGEARRFAWAVLAGLAPIESCSVRLEDIERIKREVAFKHNVTVKQMLSRSRRYEVSFPRQECMWRLREELALSFPQIARVLRRKDHTTAVHGVRAHEKRRVEQAEVARNHLGTKSVDRFPAAANERILAE